jgi:hypothetical protein
MDRMHVATRIPRVATHGEATFIRGRPSPYEHSGEDVVNLPKRSKLRIRYVLQSW